MARRLMGSMLAKTMATAVTVPRPQWSRPSSGEMHDGQDQAIGQRFGTKDEIYERSLAKTPPHQATLTLVAMRRFDPSPLRPSRAAPRLAQPSPLSSRADVPLYCWMTGTFLSHAERVTNHVPCSSKVLTSSAVGIPSFSTSGTSSRFHATSDPEAIGCLARSLFVALFPGLSGRFDLSDLPWGFKKGSPRK
jgi:hypothetical protein